MSYQPLEALNSIDHDGPNIIVMSTICSIISHARADLFLHLSVYVFQWRDASQQHEKG